MIVRHNRKDQAFSRGQVHVTGERVDVLHGAGFGVNLPLDVITLVQNRYL